MIAFFYTAGEIFQIECNIFQDINWLSVRYYGFVRSYQMYIKYLTLFNVINGYFAALFSELRPTPAAKITEDRKKWRVSHIHEYEEINLLKCPYYPKWAIDSMQSPLK